MFLDLPVELLQEIASWVSSWHSWNERRWSLRAVCRHLQLGSHRGISYLEALASGSTGWSRYTRKLHIEGVDQRLLTDSEKDQIPKLLPSALASLGSIRTVIWREGNGVDNPPMFTDIVIKFLDSLRSLDELELLHVGQRVISLSHLCDVRRLRIIDPLREQTLAGTLLAPVFQVLQHSRNLSCLYLTNWDSISTDLWDTLRREKICLAELYANDGGNNSLLAYLDSYSGLKHLILPRLDHGHRIGDAQVEWFFERILPRHATSLETLVCTAELEGPWGFGTCSYGAVLKLHKLLRIQMTVNLADIADPSTEFDKNPVELFIDAASQLPSLRTLSLLCAHPVGRKGLRRSSSVVCHRHRVRVRRQIQTILASYGPTVESPAVARWVESPRRRQCCLGSMAECRC
ncbi:hypothetical protein B0H19DRAFT_1193362 [Mycena capillaripes]|nr:hypothetical protein B0H19DRAFT_1193362 [Mycena capillaripes]